MLRKSQVATEFIVMVSLAMIVVTVFVGMIYYLSYNYSEQKNMEKVQDLGYSLQNELILAAQVEQGYQRTFTIPDKAEGADFLIGQTPNDLVLTYRQAELLFSIPKVNGTFQKGLNVIMHCQDSSNTITVNQACP